ncbi:MAG TPA: carboxypeptidase-like regulatory domain-containing protein, partial [Flavihumibacter sp.]|nr:carboxypeptidase-like regulatory domain-containing protein [Flavihumibacter sp.]
MPNELLLYGTATRMPKRWFQRNLLVILLSLIGFPLLAQETVTGTVQVGDTALVGVTVTVKGTRVSSQTDTQGKFSIKAPANATLVFSSVGYETREVAVNNQSNLTVSLKSIAQQFNEVVVVGYGTQKKATITGAVATVKGSELEKVPVVNMSNALVGRLPGITAVNASGEPGYDGSNIRIRGTNSFGNTNALIVIDGIPGRSGGLERLNPADIES